MTILEHPTAQALLGEAVLTEEQVLELSQRLLPFLERYFPHFQRTEQRRNAELILKGKLTALSRKTSEPIAHYFGVRPEVLQDFIGSSPWSDDAVLAELRRHVGEAWNDPDGVLTGDGSSFPKKGDDSCGVKRQYLWPTGQGRQLSARYLPGLCLPPRPDAAGSPAVPATGVGRRSGKAGEARGARRNSL